MVNGFLTSGFLFGQSVQDVFGDYAKPLIQLDEKMDIKMLLVGAAVLVFVWMKYGDQIKAKAKAKKGSSPAPISMPAATTESGQKSEAFERILWVQDYFKLRGNKSASDLCANLGKALVETSDTPVPPVS